ncbi:MAG: hypothetical protein GX350_03240 [Erysipelotrichaceae bacterium]|nr:hypothetical protein [Erysipelotrichaceae bacterium]
MKKHVQITPLEILNIVISAILVITATALFSVTPELREIFPTWAIAVLVSLYVILYLMFLIDYLAPKEQLKRKNNRFSLFKLYLIVFIGFLPIIVLTILPESSELDNVTVLSALFSHLLEVYQ